MPPVPAQPSSFKGLSTLAANKVLSKAVRSVLTDDRKRIEAEDKLQRWDILRRQLGAWHNIAPLVSGVLLLIGFSVGLERTDDTIQHKPYLIVGALLCFAIIALNCVLVYYRAHRLRWEVHTSVVESLLEFERATAIYNANARKLLTTTSLSDENNTSAPPSPFCVAQTDDGILLAMTGGFKAIDFHDTSKVIHALPVYRDGNWVRLPVSALAKGDLIALMDGETAPAKVRCLDGEVLGRRSSVVGMLGHVGINEEKTKGVARRPALGVPNPTPLPPDVRQRDIDVLTLCGDMKRYQLQDTPIASALRKRLRAPHRPQPLFHMQLRSWEASAWYVGTAASVLLLVAVVVRSAATAAWDGTNSATHVTFLTGILHQLPSLAVCVFCPLLPFLLVCSEMVGTAQLVAVFESVMLRKKWKDWRKSIVLDRIRAEQQKIMAAHLQSAVYVAERDAVLLRRAVSREDIDDGASFVSLNTENLPSLARTQDNRDIDVAIPSIEPRDAENLPQPSWPRRLRSALSAVFMRTPRQPLDETALVEHSVDDATFAALPAETTNFIQKEEGITEDEHPHERDGEAAAPASSPIASVTRHTRQTQVWSAATRALNGTRKLLQRRRSLLARVQESPDDDGRDVASESKFTRSLSVSSQPSIASVETNESPGGSQRRNRQFQGPRHGEGYRRKVPAAIAAQQERLKLLTEIKSFREDVGGMDERGEFIPRQYFMEGSATALQPAASDFIKPTTKYGNLPVEVSVTVNESLASFMPPMPTPARRCCMRLKSAPLRRHFNGPSFAIIAADKLQYPSCSRIMFYFRRILCWRRSTLNPLPRTSNSDGVLAAEEVRRWANTILADDLTDVGFGLSPMQAPLLTSQALMLLGNATVFCCADRNTVTEHDPVVENVMLLKGENSSAIIDLHVDDASATGIRFDDKNWQRHISSLKPVGLACTLNAHKPSVSEMEMSAPRGHQGRLVGKTTTAKIVHSSENAVLPQAAETSDKIGSRRTDQASINASGNIPNPLLYSGQPAGVHDSASASHNTATVAVETRNDVAEDEVDGEGNRELDDTFALEEPLDEDRMSQYSYDASLPESPRSGSPSGSSAAGDSSVTQDDNSSPFDRPSPVALPPAAELDAQSIDGFSPSSRSSEPGALMLAAKKRFTTKPKTSLYKEVLKNRVAVPVADDDQHLAESSSATTHDALPGVRHVHSLNDLESLLPEQGRKPGSPPPSTNVHRFSESGDPLLAATGAACLEAGFSTNDRQLADAARFYDNSLSLTVDEYVVATKAVSQDETESHHTDSTLLSTCLPAVHLSASTRGKPYKRVNVEHIVKEQIKSIAVEDARSLHKLATVVLDIPPRTYLKALADEMGFTAEDLKPFAHTRHVYTLVTGGHSDKPKATPQVGGVNSREPISDATQERDTAHKHKSKPKPRVQPRSASYPWLKPALVASIVRDSRTGRQQMLSQGNLPFLLTNCSEYWDGTSINPLTNGRRNAILAMYQQWKSEDLYCIGLAYDPVSHQEAHVLRMLDAQPKSGLRRTHGRRGTVDSIKWNHNNELPSVEVGLGYDPYNLFLLAKTGDLRLNAQADARRTGTAAAVDAPHRPSSTVEPQMFAAEAEAQLLRMQSGQIFVGMVAARYQPKPKMQKLIKALGEAGVRFVYTATRSYRKTRPLAQKMGLETGWNCAISLMPRRPKAQMLAGDQANSVVQQKNRLGEYEVDEEDEDFGVEGVISDEKRWRMLRSGVDEQLWDMKAQLPHGIPEIRTHLQEKDNVPLLVSLFTDSTPPAIAGMIRIMQENGEQVILVCSSLRKSSPLLISTADVGIAYLPGACPLPSILSMRRFALESGNTSRATRTTDPSPLPLSLVHPTTRFTASIATVHAAFKLPNWFSLHHSLRLIAEGRRSLNAMHSIVAFYCFAQFTFAAMIFTNSCTAMPHWFGIHHVLWFSWVVSPLLSLSFLWSPSEDCTMTEKRTPSKRDLYGLPVWDILPGPTSIAPEGDSGLQDLLSPSSLLSPAESVQQEGHDSAAKAAEAAAGLTEEVQHGNEGPVSEHMEGSLHEAVDDTAQHGGHAYHNAGIDEEVQEALLQPIMYAEQEGDLEVFVNGPGDHASGVNGVDDRSGQAGAQEVPDSVVVMDAEDKSHLFAEDYNARPKNKKITTNRKPKAKSVARAASQNVRSGATTFDPVTGGVHAESLIRYGTHTDCVSASAGHIVSISDRAASKAVDMLRSATSHHARFSSVTSASATASLTHGIPPSQGLLAAPPRTPVIKNWRFVLVGALGALVPNMIFFEYVFARIMYVNLSDAHFADDHYPYIRNGDPVASNRAVVIAEAVVLFFLSLWLVLHSTLFMYRSHSLRAQPPWKNTLWVASCCIILFVQMAYSHVVGAVVDTKSPFQSLSWDIWLVGLVWPFASVGLCAYIKTYDAKRFERHHKLLRAFFDTRLGMYSPR